MARSKRNVSPRALEFRQRSEFGRYARPVLIPRGKDLYKHAEGRAAAIAAGAASLASLAGLLSITVPASAYTTGSVALTAPAATRAGTLARIKPGGPMALPRNQSQARAFSGKTINVVSQNWGGYVAQQHGVRFRYVRAAFSFLMLTAQARRPAFLGIGSASMARATGPWSRTGFWPPARDHAGIFRVV